MNKKLQIKNVSENGITRPCELLDLDQNADDEPSASDDDENNAEGIHIRNVHVQGRGNNGRRALVQNRDEDDDIRRADAQDRDPSINVRRAVTPNGVPGDGGRRTAEPNRVPDDNDRRTDVQNRDSGNNAIRTVSPNGIPGDGGRRTVELDRGLEIYSNERQIEEIGTMVGTNAQNGGREADTINNSAINDQGRNIQNDRLSSQHDRRRNNGAQPTVNMTDNLTVRDDRRNISSNNGSEPMEVENNTVFQINGEMTIEMRNNIQAEMMKNTEHMDTANVTVDSNAENGEVNDDGSDYVMKEKYFIMEHDYAGSMSKESQTDLTRRATNDDELIDDIIDLTGTDLKDDDLNFIQSFERDYGSNHPVVYQGSFSDALSVIKRDLTFLLVYLHGIYSELAHEWCRNTFQNTDLIQFVDTNTLFWACNVNSEEGRAVSTSLECGFCPFFAVLTWKNNQVINVGSLEGSPSAARFITWLKGIIDTNEVNLIQARQLRAEQIATQNIRQQQDKEYEESLRCDQEKDRRKEVERKIRELEEAKRQAEMNAKEVEMKKIEQQRQEMSRNLPSAPTVSQQNTCHIQVNLGQRVINRHFMFTSTIQDVHRWIYCQSGSPTNFEILKSYPRTVVFPCTQIMTLLESGFGSRQVLFINDLDC